MSANYQNQNIVFGVTSILKTEGTVMTLGQMNSKLTKAQEVETYLDRALLYRALLEDAVDFIYSKAGAKKPSKASLL